MKVQELINRLQKCDPNAKVVYTTYYTNDSGTTFDSDMTVEGLIESDHGRKGKFVELKEYETD